MFNSGCKRGETHKTHGMAKTKLYKVWAEMKSRCLNPNNKDFKYYGGRGVIICEEWKKSELFMNWALKNGYKEGLTIERIDYNKGYEPGNCTFITQKEQNKNQRKTMLVDINGMRGEDILERRAADAPQEP